MARVKVVTFEVSCEVHPNGGASCKGDVETFEWVERVPVLVTDADGNEVPMKDDKGKDVTRLQVFSSEACASIRDAYTKALVPLVKIVVAASEDDPGKRAVTIPLKKVGGGSSSGGNGTAARSKKAAITEWGGRVRLAAKAAGKAVSENGRIADDVVIWYKAAFPNDPHPNDVPSSQGTIA